MAIPREPVLSPNQAYLTAQSQMKHAPEQGLLRAFTLHVNPRPDAEDLLRLNDLAVEHQFELRVGRPVYVEGPEHTVVFLYFVVWFLNQAPVTR